MTARDITLALLVAAMLIVICVLNTAMWWVFLT